MAKPRSGALRLHSNAPRSTDDPYLGVQIRDDHGRWLNLGSRVGHRYFQKRIDRARDRAVRDERRAHAAIDRDFRRAQRAVDAEEREADRAHRRGRRRVRSKAKLERKIEQRKPKPRPRTWVWAAQALPKLSGPIIDRNGERGVFFSVAYHGKGSKPGVAARVILYGFDGAHVNEDGSVAFAASFADSIEEAVCGADHLEQINRSASDAAKVIFHVIANVDYRLSPEQMLRTGVLFCEEAFGQHGLPWFVALHPPPEDGDQRNWHVHVCFSTRPFEHVGDHEWEAGEALRTDLDGKAHFRVLRELWADAMTNVSFGAGIRQRYTAKSNDARGLGLSPQLKLGEARTSMVRSGRFVADNEENHERVLRAETAMLDAGLGRLEGAITIERELEAQAAAMLVAPGERIERPATASRVALPDIPLVPGAMPPRPIETGAPLSWPARIPRAIVPTMPDLAKLQFRSGMAVARPLRAANQPIARPAPTARSVVPDIRFTPGAAPSSIISGIRIGAKVPARTARAWSLPALSPPRLDFGLELIDIGKSVPKPGILKSKTVAPAIMSPPHPVIPARIRFDPVTRNRVKRMRRMLGDPFVLAIESASVGEQSVDPLERLATLDPWVRVPNKAPLAIGDDALAALGQDAAWLARTEVQRELEQISDHQAASIMGALDHLVWSGDRLTAREPYADLGPALARWSRDDDFFAYLHSVAPHLDRQPGHEASAARAPPAKSTPAILEPERRSVPPGLHNPDGGRGD